MTCFCLSRGWKQIFLVILPFKAKSWAFLLDFAFQQLDKAIFLDLSKAQSLRPISRQRKQFQEKIVKSKDFKVVTIKPVKSVVSIFFTVFTDFLKYRDGRTLVDKKSSIRFDHVLECRLSAFYGKKDHDRAKTSLIQFIKHYFASKFALMQVFDYLSENGNISGLYLYNGREPLEASCILVAKALGIRVTILEKGSNNSKFLVFPNSPHLRTDWWDLIKSFNSSAILTHPENEINRQKYIGLKLSGLDPFFEHPWATESNQFQERTELIYPYILFFSSSTTEYSPFEEFNYEVGYSDQFQAVQDLAKEAIRANLNLVIRRHPNSVGIDGVDREGAEWNRLLSTLPNRSIQYFGPDRSFNLIRGIQDSECVFVWKSSTGFESLALGKTTYTLSSAKWSWDNSYSCWTRKQIREAMSTKNNPEIVADTIFKYSNFMANSGTPVVTFKSAHKWGIITSDGKKQMNGVMEDYVQWFQTKFPRLFGRRYNFL